MTKQQIALRLLLALAVLAALLYPSYLAVGNWILRARLEGWLNRRPERLLITYDKAWTVRPGVVRFEGFQIRNQTPSVQWWAAIDQGTVNVRLASLLDRQFTVDRLTGTGVAFRLRRRDDAARRPEARRRNEPPIPGLENPPREGPERKTASQPQKPRRDPWRIRLGGIDLAGVRELWIEEVRFAGQAHARGGFDLHLRESFHLEPSRLEVARGDLLIGADPIVNGTRGTVEGRIDPYVPAEHRGWDMLRFVSGESRLAGQVPSLAFLDIYMRRTRWIDTRSGSGPIELDVRMKDGRFLPGTVMTARTESLAMSFLDYRTAGAGTVRWSVMEDKGERQARLAVAFDRFAILREGYGQPHVRGEGLTLEAAGKEPRIQGGPRNLFIPLRFAIDMPHAEVPRLDFYQAYLPEAAGLALTGGSGRMSAHFQAAAPDWRGSGDLRLTAQGVKAALEGQPLQGDLDLHTRLRAVDLADRRFDISGTDLKLARVVLPGGAAWWAHTRLNRAVLAPGAPVYVQASLESTMADAGPLIRLFAPEGKKRVVRWVDNLLDLQGVGATADLTVGQHFFKLDDLAVAAGKGQLQARLRFQNGDRRGALLASYGRLDVGLELNGTERNWKVLRPRQWFAEYPAFE